MKKLKFLIIDDEASRKDFYKFIFCESNIDNKYKIELEFADEKVQLSDWRNERFDCLIIDKDLDFNDQWASMELSQIIDEFPNVVPAIIVSLKKTFNYNMYQSYRNIIIDHIYLDFYYQLFLGQVDFIDENSLKEEERKKRILQNLLDRIVYNVHLFNKYSFMQFQTKNRRKTKTFSVLHLSDLQFGDSNNIKSDEDVLFKDIENYINDNNKNIGFVIVTGDLISKGQIQKFDLLYKYFKEFIEVREFNLKYSEDRVLFVPGNHDVSRGILNEEKKIEDWGGKSSSLNAYKDFVFKLNDDSKIYEEECDLNMLNMKFSIDGVVFQQYNMGSNLACKKNENGMEYDVYKVNIDGINKMLRRYIPFQDFIIGMGHASFGSLGKEAKCNYSCCDETNDEKEKCDYWKKFEKNLLDNKKTPHLYLHGHEHECQIKIDNNGKTLTVGAASPVLGTKVNRDNKSYNFIDIEITNDDVVVRIEKIYLDHTIQNEVFNFILKNYKDNPSVWEKI